jgi:uncharacterized membrane protein
MKKCARRGALCTVVLLLLAVGGGAAFAQGASPPADLRGLWLTSEFPVVTVRAGEETRLNLSLIDHGLPPQRVTLTVENVPAQWSTELRGGGRPIGAAFVDYNAKSSLELKVKVPSDAQPGAYSLLVKAAAPDRTYDLPLTLTVVPHAAASLTAEPKLPTLRGTARSSFDFRLTVKNEGDDSTLVTLTAQAPRGFQVTFKEGYGSQELTSIPIKAGETKDIAVDVKPPQGIAAGQYAVVVQLQGEQARVQTRLMLDITGQPAITLTGENERLSGEANAGKEKRFTFVLRNTGSADARNITLSASAPSGWKTTFEPKEVAALAPNAEEKVVALVTPSDKALAGDYMMTVRASGDGASESANFRVTILTSTMWGVVGIGVIAASLVVLFGAVGRFGRR